MLSLDSSATAAGGVQEFFERDLAGVAARAHEQRAVGDAEIKVVDPVTGRRRPPGRVGEVWVRGPELFAGYADPLDTAAAVHRGWYRTGDLGVLDRDGWLAITGRLKELIIRGGENISPAEVERVLALHPDVRDVGVVGVADEQWGEVGLAVVVPEPGVTITLDELNAFAAQRLARYKLPKRLALADVLPRNVTGKLSREQLRSDHHGG